jgi:hypothetical protein
MSTSDVLGPGRTALVTGSTEAGAAAKGGPIGFTRVLRSDYRGRG